MTSIILLLTILIIGFVSTNLVFNKFRTRFYVPSGIEYIFVGILINPAFSNFLNSQFAFNIPALIEPDIMLQLSPGISAAIGIIGLTYGLRFRLSALQKAVPEHLRLAFFEIFFGFLIIGGASFGILYVVFFNGNNLASIIAAAIALSVMGGISSNFVISNIIARYEIKGAVASALDKASGYNQDFSVLIYGLLFGIIHIGAAKSINITPTEWVVISLLLAMIIGMMFFIFLGREEDENKLFVAVLGITIFTSGTAYYMNFSPLYMNFILGIILGNLLGGAGKLESSLSRLLHPLSIMVAVMAGFLWMPAGPNVFLIAVAGFILLRYLSKKAAGAAAFVSAYNQSALDSGIGRGLMPQDIIVTAMIIDYMRVYNNEFTPIVVSCVLTSVLVFSLFSFSATKNYLVDAGEITGESE